MKMAESNLYIYIVAVYVNKMISQLSMSHPPLILKFSETNETFPGLCFGLFVFLETLISFASVYFPELINI